MNELVEVSYDYVKRVAALQSRGAKGNYARAMRDVRAIHNGAGLNIIVDLNMLWKKESLEDVKPSDLPPAVIAYAHKVTIVDNVRCKIRVLKDRC